VCAALVTTLLVLAFSGAARCIDTPVFYHPPALVGAAIGVGLIATGAATMIGAGRAWLGILLLSIGVVLLSAVLSGAPFRACGQFPTPVFQP
jgi:hypothetical protein